MSWGIAASVALAAGWSFLPGQPDLTTIETAAGERRTLQLEDGSRIVMNGGTRIVLDEDRTRFARLDRGEALFEVVHDARLPFEVETGDALLRDMGTVFNVIRDAEQLEVAVSDGAVLFNPGREAKNLSPGMTLRQKAGAPLWVGSSDRAAIGTWREGRLTYSAAPVARIAADLSRNLGVPVQAKGAAGRQTFSGVILLDGSAREVLQRSAALLGCRLTGSDAGWTLTTGSGATG
jgi:transmembrane sensor